DSSPANSLLAVENWARRTVLHREYDERENRQRKDESDQPSRKVQDPAQDAVERAEAEPFGEDQPARMQLIDFDPAVNLLQPGGGFFNLHTLQAKIKQFFHGKCATAI